MLSLNPVETELTTGATDAILGLLAIGLAAWLMLLPTELPWKRNVWMAMLVCMAIGSALGAIAHGLVLSEPTKALLWKPLYLSLGLAVALVAVGAVYDWWGAAAAARFLPWALVVAVIFFAASQWLGGAFVIFILYEGVATLFALAIYARLASQGGLPGAGAVALGVLVSLAAAAVQVSRLQLTLGVTFDHNGLFHLVQMVGLIVMMAGVRQSL